MNSNLPTVLNRCAESYVALVLSVGNHDPDYVDAYYGPDHLKTQAQTEKPSLDQIRPRATAAIAELASLDLSGQEEITRLRHQYLLRQLQSLVARVEMLQGRKLTFDEESKSLYDAVAPVYSESHFRTILEELGSLLGGSGRVPERYEQFKKSFIVPREKLDAVFTAAITEGRRRTRLHIDLPETESFIVEYVTGKSWSGYNWYKGNGHSLIQVNTDLPIYIDRAVDLACHEGYPGHHVYNSMLETHLARKRGWIEFMVYALFSPQSLIAEGTANYGIDMALPEKDRILFEREVLFPLAGLDPHQSERYYAIHALFLRLNYAGNEAARQYLDGTITRDEAARWLVHYALMSPERAQQRTRFFDQYRSYVINYNLGQDLVKQYMEKRGGTPDRPELRWRLFAELLSSPRLPSSLL